MNGDLSRQKWCQPGQNVKNEVLINNNGDLTNRNSDSKNHKVELNQHKNGIQPATYSFWMRKAMI